MLAIRRDGDSVCLQPDSTVGYRAHPARVDDRPPLIERRVRSPGRHTLNWLDDQRPPTLLDSSLSNVTTATTDNKLRCSNSSP